jgi:cytochrome c-type biogenesis protein CcmH/NrfG
VTVLVLAAIIVVGGLMAWNLRPDRNLTGDGPAPIAVNQVGDVSAAEMSDIARKIQDKLDRKTDEVTAQSAQEIQEAADDATAKKKTIAERIRDGEIIRVQPTPGSRIPLGKKKKYQTPQIQTKGPASTRSEPKKDVVVKPSKDPGQLYLTVARKKLASNDYGAAAKAARTAIQKSPNCKACWTTLGEAYQKLGKPQEAAEAFATAEKLAAGSGGSSQAGQ